MFMYSALVLCAFFSATKTALVNPRSETPSFKQCLISSPTSLGYCLGIGALSQLQSIDNDPEYDVVDGVTFSRDDQQVRDYNTIDRNPGDLRSIVDSIGDVFSRRFLKWDMGFIYPGLLMRVAPSVSPPGVLEFVMDPHREAHSLNLKEATTGQLVARQFLLPFLVGFKFNVSALVPIIFGIIALVAKKALLLSKIGLILSSTIGLSSILFGNKYPAIPGGPGLGAYPYPPIHNPGPNYGGYYGYAPRYPDEVYLRDPIYREGQEDPQTEGNQVKFYSSEDAAYKRSDKATGRNFAWNDDEKKQKKKA